MARTVEASFDSPFFNKLKGLAEIAKVIVGPYGISVDVWGRHLTVKSIEMMSQMDVYPTLNEINIYISDWENPAVKLAEALKDAGEGEYIVRKNYDSI